MYLKRQENKKKERGNWRRRLVVGTAGLAAVSSALFLYLHARPIAGFARAARDFVIEHPIFSVREIKVSGQEKMGGSEVVALAGLIHGMSIWKIEPEIIERRIGKHPWVRRVLVRREFPGRVVIELEERRAKGIAALGKLFYVDAEGFVFKEVGESEEVNYPLLTGLKQADLLSEAQFARRKIQEALGLADLMEKSSFAVSEIRFLPTGGVVLYPMAHAVALHMGWGEWEEKKIRLERVLALWQGREDRLAALDLSFRDQVVVRPRKAEG